MHTARLHPQHVAARTLPTAALALTLATALAAPAQAATLFDAAAGLPGAQGWTTLTISSGGAAGNASLAGGLYTLDSTVPGVDTFGQWRLSPVTLDPAGGWQADLRLRIVDETHTSNDRAGFSMLFVGSPATGSIEIAFREDRIFAYAYQGGSFVQGVGAAVDTTDQLHDYQLLVSNQQFSFARDGTLLFSGNLQDYTPQGLPYNVGGFLFFGDNTSSGSGIAELARIDLVNPVPEPGSAALLASGLLLLGAVARRSRRAAALRGPAAAVRRTALAAPGAAA